MPLQSTQLRHRSYKTGILTFNPHFVPHANLLSLVRDEMGLAVEISPDDSVAIDRSLDGSRFGERIGWQAPTWREMVAAMVADPTPYSRSEVQHAGE